MNGVGRRDRTRGLAGRLGKVECTVNADLEPACKCSGGSGHYFFRDEKSISGYDSNSVAHARPGLLASHSQAGLYCLLCQQRVAIISGVEEESDE